MTFPRTNGLGSRQPRALRCQPLAGFHAADQVDEQAAYGVRPLNPLKGLTLEPVGVRPLRAVLIEHPETNTPGPVIPLLPHGQQVVLRHAYAFEQPRIRRWDLHPHRRHRGLLRRLAQKTP